MTGRAGLQRSRSLAGIAATLVFAALLLPAHGVADTSAKKPVPPVDLYLFVEQWPVWVGSSISYTVYTPVTVEGRILSVTGEIILVLQEGVKQPGLYTLPFDGHYHGSPLAGFYTFELYFGDDFAFKSQMVAMPAEPVS
ncbi:MAG: hypothetical protein HZB43_03625 [candidate division Zixibacteria bacterium]|nr:hypothetical protein [candidate division Zixibacteria bacterium]